MKIFQAIYLLLLLSDVNIDSLISGLDAQDKDLFRREFAKEAKKYG